MDVKKFLGGAAVGLSLFKLLREENSLGQDTGRVPAPPGRPRRRPLMGLSVQDVSPGTPGVIVELPPDFGLTLPPTLQEAQRQYAAAQLRAENARATDATRFERVGLHNQEDLAEIAAADAALQEATVQLIQAEAVQQEEDSQALVEEAAAAEEAARAEYVEALRVEEERRRTQPPLQPELGPNEEIIAYPPRPPAPPEPPYREPVASVDPNRLSPPSIATLPPPPSAGQPVGLRPGPAPAPVRPNVPTFDPAYQYGRLCGQDEEWDPVSKRCRKRVASVDYGAGVVPPPASLPPVPSLPYETRPIGYQPPYRPPVASVDPAYQYGPLRPGTPTAPVKPSPEPLPESPPQYQDTPTPGRCEEGQVWNPDIGACDYPQQSLPGNMSAWDIINMGPSGGAAPSDLTPVGDFGGSTGGGVGPESVMTGRFLKTVPLKRSMGSRGHRLGRITMIENVTPPGAPYFHVDPPPEIMKPGEALIVDLATSTLELAQEATARIAQELRQANLEDRSLLFREEIKNRLTAAQKVEAAAQVDLNTVVATGHFPPAPAPALAPIPSAPSTTQPVRTGPGSRFYEPYNPAAPPTEGLRPLPARPAAPLPTLDVSSLRDIPIPYGTPTSGPGEGPPGAFGFRAIDPVMYNVPAQGTQDGTTSTDLVQMDDFLYSDPRQDVATPGTPPVPTLPTIPMAPSPGQPASLPTTPVAPISNPLNDTFTFPPIEPEPVPIDIFPGVPRGGGGGRDAHGCPPEAPWDPNLGICNEYPFTPINPAGLPGGLPGDGGGLTISPGSFNTPASLSGRLRFPVNFKRSLGGFGGRGSFFG